VPNLQKNTPVKSPSISKPSKSVPRDKGACWPQLIQCVPSRESGPGFEFVVNRAHPPAALITRDVEIELVTLARLRYEDLLIRHPDVDPKYVAMIMATRVSDTAERRLYCYQEERYRQVSVRHLDIGRTICIGRPLCKSIGNCVAGRGQHGDRFAKLQGEGWFGQLTQSLAKNVVDVIRRERNLSPASWYQLVFTVPVDYHEAATWTRRYRQCLPRPIAFARKPGSIGATS